jgi:hypothetical protein
MFECRVYEGNKLVFLLRDSFCLLPSKLADLAQNMCPELGSKGDIDHSTVSVEKLSSMKNELQEYLKQDVRWCYYAKSATYLLANVSDIHC